MLHYSKGKVFFNEIFEGKAVCQGFRYGLE